MKLSISIVVTLFAAAQARFIFQQDWETWKSFHGKSYDAQEEQMRQYIWESNLKYVMKHNMEAAEGCHSYTLEMNRFADLDEDEWRGLILGDVTRKETDVSFCNSTHVGNPLKSVYKKKVDWRKSGYVTPVKNQLQCGSCWAFSTTGSLEGQHFKKTGKLVSLSEQNLVDCSKAEGNMGCHGGLMDNGFKYIKINKGIDTEESYPYTAKDGTTCKYTRANLGATLTGCVDIEQGSETALMDAVETVGPISVAIDAGHKSFQLYKSGVYYEPECSSTKLDHGVLAVGYGKHKPASGEGENEEYWLVKNSWGKDWGLHGFIMMARNKKNHCGIATQASYPLV